MKLQNLKSSENTLFWLILLLSGFIIIFRSLFYSADSYLFLIGNDFAVILLATAVFLFVVKKIRHIDPLPASIVINIGIIIGFTFFLSIFSESILNIFEKSISGTNKNPAFFEKLILSFYSLLLLVITSYWFAALAQLYFYKRYSSKNIYFNLMVVFLILTSIVNLLFKEESYKYITNTFEIITIVLIAINSIKISWIAFISKKEKLSLLLSSSIISGLFIACLVNNGKEDFSGQIVVNFSHSLYSFYTMILLYGSIYFGVLFFTTLFHIPTAEVYDRKSKEITSLQYFSKLITQVLDFDELSETITDITIKVSSADSAWIVIKNKNEYQTVANKNITYADAEMINHFLLQSGVCNNIDETKFCSLKKFNDKNKLSEKFGSIAVSPLKSLNDIKGYLVAARKNEMRFFEEDKNAINTFADYASVAIENSLLLEQSIEKERLEKELDVAREIQKKILPANDPEFDNLSITSVFIPAFEVGGDYYDFFHISKDKLGFIVADVSGKGISAAFIMAEVKGIFSSLSRMIESPKEILIKANQILKHTLKKNSFVSALYGVIDIGTGELKIARAGHCPALLIKKDKIEKFKPTGLGLGISYDSTFNENLEELQINLNEDEVLVLYTDGITEAKNKEFEDFGEDSLTETLIKNSAETIDKIANEVIKDVTLFSKSHTQYDDITLVILKWNKNKINMETKNGRVQHLG